MKKFLVFLGIFILMCPTTYASGDNFTKEYFQSSEYEEIPNNVVIAANLVGEKYNISPELLEAIAYYESRYIADIKNAEGCYGLMQIHLSSHRKRLQKLNIDESDICNPYNNILIAADILSELFEEYEDVAVVLAIYHGEKNISTSNPSKYVSNILDYSAKLEKRHEY